MKIKNKLYKYFTENYLQNIILISLLIGFILQVYNFTLIYLQFNTVIDVIVDNSETFHLPSITLCAPFNISNINIYNNNNNNNDKNNDNSNNYNNYNNNINNNTINYDHLDKFSWLYIDDIAKYGKLKNNLTFECILRCIQDKKFKLSDLFCEHINCAKYSSVIITIQLLSFKYIYKCYTFFSWNEWDIRNSYNIKIAPDRYLIDIKVLVDNITNIYIMLQSGESIPYIGEEDGIDIEIGTFKSIHYDFLIEKSYFLPAPYKSNCSYYHNYKQGRRGCLYECRIYWFEKLYGIWPYNVPAFEDTRKSFNKINQKHLRHRKILGINDEINKKCNEKCSQKSCFKIDYTPNVKYLSLDKSKSSKNETLLKFIRKYKCAITYLHRPAEEFVEYFTYWGSAIGIWFGISAKSVIAYLQLMFNKLRKFYKYKHNFKYESDSKESSINRSKYFNKEPRHSKNFTLYYLNHR